MNLKRWLIALPLVVVAALAQSYFWVPTYEDQSTGNPARLSKYIDASIGDAEVLNPILNADTVSNQITGLVFEGLLDLDAELRLRGRIATDWGVTEEAYLSVNPERRFPDGTPVSGPVLLRRVAEGMASGELRALEGLVTAMRLLPPERRTETIELPPQGDAAPQKLGVTLEVPERLHFSLERVDQDFFGYLEPVIGPDYLAGFPYERHIRTEDPAALETIRPRFDEILTVAEHNPVILFHLRKGVRFHDGQEVTAEDVRFTYEAIMNPRNLSPRGSDFEPIKRVEVPDPYTVRVVYKRLYSPAINAWTMGILPAHLLSEEALRKEMTERGLSEAARAAFGMRDAGFNRAPIGAGPFRFVEWQSDERIHLKRNEDYWEGAPEYQDYYLRIIPDLLTQEVEFRTGAIDYYGALPHQVNRYLKDPKYQSFTSLAFAYSYIGYNLRRPVFQDARVRRALGMAIDVGEIIQYLFYGEGEQVTGPYAKDSDWYDPSVSPLPYDPAGARRILEEAGFKPNAEGWLERDGKVFEFNLITNTNPQRKNIMTVAQNAWKKIGVKCNTQYFEWAVFLKDFVNKGEFDALVLGWSMTPLDPDLYQLFHSSQTGPEQLNFVAYKSPEADDLIVEIRQEYDRERQRKLAHTLHRRIAEDQPYTFLYAPKSTRVLDKKIVIVEREPDGRERYVKIYPTKGGNISYYFNRWRKLAMTPDF